MGKTIDILLAVRNGEMFLPDLLESLLAQTEQNFRLLVSDNGSTDETVRVLEEYRGRFGDRFEFMPLDYVAGSAARNFARLIDAAEAPYVMFCDCDDVWLPRKIEIVLTRARRAEAKYGSNMPILVHTDLTVVNKNLAVIHPSFWKFQFSHPHAQLNRLLVQNAVTGCASLVNRALWLRARPVPDAAIMHDWWFALVAAGIGIIETIDEPTILYRQHGGNDTGAKHWGLRRILHTMGSFPWGMKETLSYTEVQAAAFLERFADQLSPEEYAAVSAFATLGNANGIVRRWRLVRYGIWKTGLLRNIGMLLAI